MYSTDLAFIHHAGFGGFARDVAPEIASVLHRHGIRRGLIVELGCGSGIVARHLGERGFEVRGFDVSPAMLRLARAYAPRASFRIGSIATAPLLPCDAIVAVGEVVTYAPGGLPALRRFFGRAHAALRPGGILLFDFIAAARRRTFPEKTVSGRGWRIDVSASFDNRTGILTRQMRIARQIGGRTRWSRETHRVRVYDRAAVVDALRRCGFEVRAGRAFGRVRLLPGDVAVVARKVDHV